MEEIARMGYLEFDVYGPGYGWKKWVPGPVYLPSLKKDIICIHDGIDCPAAWFAPVTGILVELNARGKLPEYVRGRVRHSHPAAEALKALASEVNRYLGKSDKTTFRLGQMDMRESAADMLEDVSKQTEDGLAASAFLQAAALVRGMEIPGGK